jgi:hypothetical protein
MSSYMAIDQADVIVVKDSTIGREAYGFGKKVLFANFTGYDMYRTPVDTTCYTEDVNFANFEDKLLSLCSEPYSDFILRTRISRERLMESAKHSGDWTLKQIRRDILRKIEIHRISLD